MDLLRTAVVDITTLVATCRALKAGSFGGDLTLRRKLRARLRRDIEEGTLAYIETLARAKRGVVDAALLGACREAAETRMVIAVANEEFLRRLMSSEPGSLDGLAAARQDLWRLAHMTMYLRSGMANLRASAASVDAGSAVTWAARLRRRLRRAMIAYARASLRGKEPTVKLIAKAREAAREEIGRRGASEAERLADFESSVNPAHPLIGPGVAKALIDLELDWGARPTQAGTGIA